MPKKVDQYENERKDVLNRMLEILGITEENKEICLNDIDNDPEKIERINELDTDIKKYFLTSKWAAFKSKPIKRRYFSLLKSLLKEFNITYKTQTQRLTNFDGNKSSTSKTTSSVKIIIEI